MGSRFIGCILERSDGRERAQSAADEERTWEELAILLLVEPGAFDVEELEAGDQAREGERVDCQLGNRLVRASIRLVVQDVYGAVAHLQEIDVSGDRALGRTHPR